MAGPASGMSGFGGTVPGGGNGTRLLPAVGGAPGRAACVNITIRPMPFWYPGVLSASTNTGRVAPHPITRTPRQT